MQNLQLRGRQGFPRREARFQKAGIIRRLQAHVVHQLLAPSGASAPIQPFQQGQHRRAVDADGSDEVVFRRGVQCANQALPPCFVPASVQGDGGEDVQMDAVDVPPAAADVIFQRGEGQHRRPRLPVRQLHHGLGEILVALHDVYPHGVSGRLFPVPGVRVIQVAGVKGDPDEHGVHIGQEPLLPLLGKFCPERFDRPISVLALPCRKKASGQQTVDGEFHVRRAALAYLADAGDDGQHPAGDVLALFKFAFGDGAVRKANAVPPQYGLHRAAEGLVEQIVPLAPGGKILAAVHDAGQCAGDGEGGE